jgi:hypothetical protein
MLETKPGCEGDEGGCLRRLELITGTGRGRNCPSEDKARIVVATVVDGVALGCGFAMTRRTASSNIR